MVDVELDSRNTGRWRRCVRVSLAGRDLPQGWIKSARIGLVARTSATASDNHDVLSLRVFDSAAEAAVQDAEGHDGDDGEDDYMVSVYIYVYICLFAYMCVYVFTIDYSAIWLSYIYMCVHMYMFVYIYVCVCVYKCVLYCSECTVSCTQLLCISKRAVDIDALVVECVEHVQAYMSVSIVLAVTLCVASKCVL